jgi:hypothetical protein
LRGFIDRRWKGIRSFFADGQTAERMPAWLVSIMVHLAALLVLSLISIRGVTQLGNELALIADTASAEAPLELAVAFEMEPPAEAPLFVAEPLALGSASSATLAFESPTDAFRPSALGDMNLLAQAGSGLNGIGNQGSSSLFGLSAAGAKFVYVFDRSGSMRSEFVFDYGDGIENRVTPLALAKAELVRSLNQLSNKSHFQIIFYNDKPLPFGADSKAFDASKDLRLLRATDPLKAQARSFVKKVNGRGNTEHLAALQMAVKMRPDAVFLITDAVAQDDPSWSELRDLARFCQNRRIRVNVIHFSDQERPESTLVRLTVATRGMHRFLNLRDLAPSAQ